MSTNIRILYKAILRLHRALPSELKELGDVYVKDEFRRHTKSSNAKDHLSTFLDEWTTYYETLVRQVDPKSKSIVYGKPLASKLDQLDEQQIYQLYELKKSIDPETETTKPENRNLNELSEKAS